MKIYNNSLKKTQNMNRSNGKINNLIKKVLDLLKDIYQKPIYQKEKQFIKKAHNTNKPTKKNNKLTREGI